MLAGQLVQELPVVAVCLSSKRRDQIVVLSIAHMGSLGGSTYFWSLLALAQQDYAVADLEVECVLEPEPGHSVDEVNEDEVATLFENEKRGRPRIEDTPHGGAIVTFVRNYIFSRGQPTQEKTRLQSSSRVYGAPLRHIAKELQSQLGITVSYSAIRNLMQAKRRNSVGPCRGIIDAKVASLRADIMKWDPRSAWSATLSRP